MTTIDEGCQPYSRAALALLRVLSNEAITAMQAFNKVRNDEPEFNLAELQQALYELKRDGAASIDENLRVSSTSAPVGV